MLNKLTLGLIMGAAAAGAAAQTVTDIQAGAGSSAYVHDARGVVARSGYGLCWRTGYWTTADAIPGCDGELVPPVASAIAPPIVATPPAEAPAPAAPVAPPALPCGFTFTLENAQTFAFDQATLTDAAMKRIDDEVLGKLGTCGKLERVIVTGHTDRLGTEQYNQQLSRKRAEAVVAYLESKGIAAPIDAIGAGESQPVKSCSDKLGIKKLQECLAPNRRVAIEVRGFTK